MMDSSEDEEESTVLQEELSNDPSPRANEVVVDQVEDQSTFSDASSLASLLLSDGPPSIKPRAYQLEILEESLKCNIICSMDTGSGKTHV